MTKPTWLGRPWLGGMQLTEVVVCCGVYGKVRLNDDVDDVDDELS